jgi:hypothetical protein
MNRSHWLWLAALLLLASVPVRANDWSVFEGPTYRLVLPGTWKQSGSDGALSYRAADDRQGLMASLYVIDERMRAQAPRAALLLHSADLRRSAELRLGSKRLSLSAVVQDRSGDYLRTRYVGTDGDRRFINLALSAPGWIQNFYYEAVGLPQAEFDRRVADIFEKLEIRRTTGSEWLEARSCAAPGTQCLPATQAARLTERLDLPRVVALPLRRH